MAGAGLTSMMVVGTHTHSTGVKLVILDEADHLTNDAQFALRRVIEKYTKNTR